MRKFLMLVATMLCILCGALAFAACGETNGSPGDAFVKSVQVDERGHLTVTYSDGTVKDLGEFEPSAQTGTEGLQYQKRKDEAGNEYAAVVGLGTVWETDIVIPAEFRGLPVKEIGRFAFEVEDEMSILNTLTSITIPDSVTEIGDRAFYNCGGLTSVKIGSGVTSMGDRAFGFCTGLTEITIPNSVSSIGDRAFYNCGGLTSVKIGSGVTSIGAYAFYECSGLEEITIPDSVTEIGEYAFYHCSELTEITIPDSVTSIGESAFSGTAYDKDHWTEDVLYIGNHLIEAKDTISGSYSIRNGTKTIADSAFSYCDELTEITIPDSVLTIGYEAFVVCRGLTEITIPNSVTEIGEHAFENCSGLRNVYFENPNGWSANGEPISGLEDPATAALYLTSLNYGYIGYSWERID